MLAELRIPEGDPVSETLRDGGEGQKAPLDIMGDPKRVPVVCRLVQEGREPARPVALQQLCNGREGEEMESKRGRKE